MSVVNVQARTVTLTDYVSNTDKFYTTYAVGPFEIRQWGRIGVIGQFSIEKHSNPATADASARDQINAKVKKGYGDREDLNFQFDLDKLGNNPNKEQAKWVAHAKDAAAASKPILEVVLSDGFVSWRGAGGVTLDNSKIGLGKPVPALSQPSVTQVSDRFESFTTDALKAITLAVTEPAQAGIVYAQLNERWRELEEVTAKAQSYLSTLSELVSASMS